MQRTAGTKLRKDMPSQKDILEGLYYDDYFTTPQKSDSQDPVDGVHEIFNPKN